VSIPRRVANDYGEINAEGKNPSMLWVAVMKWIRSFFLVLILTALGNAKTITVDLNGSGDYTDIKSAIDATKDGNTVLVRLGEYVITESITFLRKAITVMAESTSSFGKSRN